MTKNSPQIKKIYSVKNNEISTNFPQTFPQSYFFYKKDLTFINKIYGKDRTLECVIYE